MARGILEVRRSGRACSRRAFLVLLVVGGMVAGRPDATSAQEGRNATMLGHLDERSVYNDVWGYRASDGTEVAILGTSLGTQFIDVTDPEAPVEISFVEGPPSSWRDIKTHQSYAYIVNDNGSEEALQIVDLSDPQKPVKVYGSSEFFRRAHNLFVDGATLYAVGTDRAQGYVALDLSEPAVPREIGTFDEFYIHDIFVRDGLAYAAQVFVPAFLAILEVADPASPRVVSRVRYDGAMTHNTWLSDDGVFCVTTDETAGGHLRVWNVEDPEAVFLVGEWSHPEDQASSVHNAFFQGTRLYCSWYTAGLEVIDLTRPDFPQRIASFDTFPTQAPPVFTGAWGVYPYLPSGTVLISDTQRGLYTVRVDPVLGTVRLHTRDAGSGQAIATELSFANEPLERGLSALTGDDGGFELFLTPGSRRVTASAFGYETADVTIEVLQDQIIEVDLDLLALPSGSLTGRVREVEFDPPLGSPVAGVEISIVDTPLQTRTDLDGNFTIPLIPAGTWTMKVRRFGFRTESIEVEIAPGSVLDQPIGLIAALVADPFETETNWVVGSPDDDATSGVWVREDPRGTGGGRVAPEDDHSESGVFAFLTGNGGGDIGDDDVDGGQTTLRSPPYDLSGLDRPWLEFQLWYWSGDGDDPNSDVFTVEASSDGGVSWTTSLQVAANTDGWSEQLIPIGAFVQTAGEVLFRFLARDSGVPSIVEVALDDLQIFEGWDGEYFPPLPPGVTLQLDPPVPNPFAEDVRLRFRVDEVGEVALEVFDASGRRLRRIAGSGPARGPGQIIWDGRMDGGERAPSGAYWLRLRAGSQIRTLRVVRIR